MRIPEHKFTDPMKKRVSSVISIIKRNRAMTRKELRLYLDLSDSQFTFLMLHVDSDPRLIKKNIVWEGRVFRLYALAKISNEEKENGQPNHP